MRALILSTLLAAGCGGMYSQSSQEVADYRATANALAAVVEAHAQSAPAAAPATCAAAMSDYAQKAGALVDRMKATSGSLDRCMTGLGRADKADLAAGCSAIRSELDAHVANGCSAQSLGAEMSRHGEAMRAHTGRELDRMGEMEGMESGMSSSMMGNRGCR